MAATTPNIQSKYQKSNHYCSISERRQKNPKTSPQVLVDGNEAVVCGALGQNS